MLIATGVMTCASVAPVMAKSLTDTKTEPKMIGYGQQWDTDVAKGILGTSINGYQYQGNSLQLNMLQFEKYTTPKGENALAIRLGANIDGVNKSGNIYLVDKNTKNQTLTTTINGSVIKTVLTDTDDKKVESSVDIGGYVDKTVKKAKTEVKAGTNIASVTSQTANDGHTIYTVNAKGTKVTGDANFVVDPVEENGNVTNYKMKLADTVNIGGRNPVRIDGTVGAITGLTNTGIDYDGFATTGKAATEEQLKAATENAGWNLSTGKEITNPTKVKSGATVDFSGDDENITVSREETDFATLVNVKLNRNLNVDSIHAGDFFMNNDMGIGFGGEAYITQSGLNANDKVISNVAAGVYNTDAVNVGQLKEVEEVAANANKGWNLSTNGVATEATNVAPGEYVDFSGDKNISVSRDRTKVKVELNDELKDIKSIIGAGEGAGSISFADGGKVKVNDVIIEKGGKITGVAAGTADTDAVNYGQLKDVKAEAGKHTTLSNGKNTTVESTVKDGQTDYKVNVAGDLTDITSVANGDSKINLNKDSIIISNGNKYFAITNSGIGMSYIGADYSAKSIMLGENGTTISGGLNVAGSKITGVAAGTEDTDAVNVSQLKKVSDTANAGWNLATNGFGTEATNVKPGDYVDFSGDKNISVSHDGTKVQVKLNKNIDVNYVQTNALNSKYSLSVGTMAENGIMPFLVSSTGAFYAANNNFSVDKDGKVIATAGEIGNVVLQNGVYTGNSALRDGELYLGDASGNYSQITPKSAKLGQVTIDEKGNMAGVNSIQTNALNAKYNLSVGTMAENGIMPFLVSSTGAFYAANNNFSVDKDGKVIATAGEIGNVVLQNGVYTGNSALRDGELYVGDASGNYSQITTTGAKLGQVTIAADGKISGVAAGEVSKTSTDAINGSQLNQTNENVAALDKRVTQNEADIAQNKADIAQNKADIAQNKADIAQNKADIAQNKADIAQNKADIAQNKADIATNKQNIDKLNTRVDGVEKLAKQHTTVTAGDNIAVTETTNKDGGKEYNVALKNNIDLGDKGSVTTGQTEMNNDGLKVGDNVSVSATAVTAGQTSISDEGLAVGPNTSLKADELKVDGKTYIDKNGLNANGMQITNVADGKENSDAVNVGQLKESEKTINNRIDGVENQVVNNTNRINKLGSRVNKVGAGAAALAALHPMDFDPDDKLTFSAGYGNYGGENAAAIGAYYRPDEKVMFSVAGTVGNGENMVNAGVSFALDRTNHVSNSRTALAREVIDLRGQLAVMGAKMAKMEKAFGMLDETKTKLFPDVPANHWAYEYIAKLAGNGYIEGYPDGNFGGDRLMTRYEFAAMLYRAIEKGAALEEKIIKEFEPELGRIRVDRISGEDGDRNKIERVRVNDTKGERDHYGNKLAK